MDAVVIIATVLAPILSLKIHAMMNGTKIPKPVVERPWIEAWIGRALRICPKAPPAPVMARIAALSVIPADTQERVFFFSCFGIIPIARNTPIRRATTGLPRNVKIFATAPVAPRIETTEAIPMRMIGRRIGAKLWRVPGSLPYFF